MEDQSISTNGSESPELRAIGIENAQVVHRGSAHALDADLLFVDLVGLAEHEFDYRVEITTGCAEFMENGFPRGPARVDGIWIHAHEEQPSISSSRIRQLNLGPVLDVAREAALGWILENKPFYFDRADGSDATVNHMFRSSTKRHRRTVDEIRRNDNDVADYWHQWVEAGRPGSHREWIARKMGWGDSDAAKERVKASMRRAQKNGLVPKATSTRNRTGLGKWHDPASFDEPE